MVESIFKDIGCVLVYLNALAFGKEGLRDYIGLARGRLGYIGSVREISGLVGVYRVCSGNISSVRDTSGLFGIYRV